MALQVDNVRVAGTGEVFVAPSGTAAPTDAAAALAAAWVGLGYTSTDGVEFTVSRNTQDIDGWQGSKLRVVTESQPVSIKFALMETDAQSLSLALGGGTAVTATGKTTYTPPKEGENAIRSAAVKFTDGSVNYLYYFPRVQVEGDVSFKLSRSEAVMYDVTLGVLANDPKFTILTDDPNFGVVIPKSDTDVPDEGSKK